MKNLNDRIILTRLVTNGLWDVVSNPRWDTVTRAASTMLENASNLYVEYRNAGVIYRIVRRKDVYAYGVNPKTAVGISVDDKERT